MGDIAHLDEVIGDAALPERNNPPLVDFRNRVAAVLSWMGDYLFTDALLD